MTVPSKSNVPSLWPWPLTYEGQFFQWIEYNPISSLYKFKIDISSNSREIKYQNIGRTHRHTDRHTHRQTGRVKTIPRNPLRGRGNNMASHALHPNCLPTDLMFKTQLTWLLDLLWLYMNKSWASMFPCKHRTRIVCIRPKGRTQCIFPRSQHSCLYVYIYILTKSEFISSCNRPAVGSNIVQITRATFFVNVFFLNGRR